MTRKAVFALALMLAGFSTQAWADVFPDQPYGGMQIDYQLDGIAATGFDDRETARTVTRILEGVLTGAKVKVSGLAYSVEDRADLIVTISAGVDMKKDSFTIKPNPGRRDFSFEIKVPEGARGSHISVLINPENAGKDGKKSLRLDVTAVPKR